MLIKIEKLTIDNLHLHCVILYCRLQKYGLFCSLQVRTNGHTKGLERDWKHVWGSRALAREAFTLLQRYTKPILREKPTVLLSSVILPRQPIWAFCKWPRYSLCFNQLNPTYLIWLTHELSSSSPHGNFNRGGTWFQTWNLSCAEPSA